VALPLEAVTFLDQKSRATFTGSGKEMAQMDSSLRHGCNSAALLVQNGREDRKKKRRAGEIPRRRRAARSGQAPAPTNEATGYWTLNSS
jgi:hypothetical protein